MDRIDLSNLSCPACGADLERQPESVVCGDCGQIFPVTDGIMDLRCAQEDHGLCPVPRDQLQNLNRDHEPGNWAQTVRRLLSLAPDKEAWVDDLVVDGRYAWKVFLDLTPEMKLLDLGCGWGNLSANLAPHVGQVYAMDLVLERLEFARHRFAAFNRDDHIALLAAGDGGRLPFRSSSLDVVAISGLAEWTEQVMAYRADHGGSRALPDLLAEVRRILKENGQLYVSVANRFGYEYPARQRRFYTRLPYGALIPRSIAKVFPSSGPRGPNPASSLSMAGCRGLMADAGFDRSAILGLYRGQRFLEEIVPAAGEFKFWQSAAVGGSEPGRKKWPYFAPAFGIVASSGGRPPSGLLDQVLDSVASAIGKPLGSLQVSKLEISRKGKLIVKALEGSRPIYIRLPFNEAALQAEQRNFQRLTWLREQRPGLGALAPEAVAEGLEAQQTFFAETGLTGATMAAQAHDRSTALAAVGAGLDFLAQLNPADVSGSLTFDDAVLEQQVGARLSALKSVLTSAQVTSLDEVYRRHLGDAALPSGLVHGDYSVTNLMIGDGIVTGIFDWEESQSNGIPAIDAVGLVISATRMTGSRQSFSERYIGVAQRDAAFGDLQELLDVYYKKAGIDPQHHAGVVLLSWLHVVSHRLRFGLAYDQARLERYVTSVVERLNSEF